MLWEYQRVVDGLKKTGPGSDKVSMPISSRTRGTLRLQTSHQEVTPTKVKGGNQKPGSSVPSTPTRSMERIIQETAKLGFEDLGEFNSPTPSSIQTPFSAALHGDDGNLSSSLLSMMSKL